MSSSEEKIFSETEVLCVVCFKSVLFYSIGVCDHAVCFECSTRMRVLCQTNECPICRRELPKVVFTQEVEPYNKLIMRVQRTGLQDRKYGLYFCSPEIQSAYLNLLEYKCEICKDSSTNYKINTFQQLKDHMRKEHELFYCDICVDNLKIFGFERRAYNRQELALHRRKGDPDNTSHRGHPLCEFCDRRYMDSDELFRHLRRNHFFCHLCDADGKHQYYMDIEELRKHFRDEHYLCEEGECRNMPVAAVFRENIDLKAHIAVEHSRNLSKSANKQARTVEFEINLAPRPRIDRHRRTGYRDRDEEYSFENLEPGGPGGGDRMSVKPLTPQDFPALGNASSAPQPRHLATVSFTSKVNTLNPEDFPSLGGPSSSGRPTSAVSITTNSSSKPQRTQQVTITKTSGGQQSLQRNSQNFPVLGMPPGSSSGSVHLRVNNNQDPTTKSSKVSIHLNHKPNHTVTTITSQPITTHQQPPPPRQVEAFPALGNSDATSSLVPPIKWVSQKVKKPEPKVSKVAPPPELPSRSDLSQFPSLSKNKSEKKSKKSSSVTVPVTQSWVNLNEFNSKSSNNSESSNAKQSSDNNYSKTKSKSKNEERASSSRSTAQSNAGVESKFDDLKINLSDGKSKNKKKKSKSNTNNTEINQSALKLNNKQSNDSNKTSNDSVNKYLTNNDGDFEGNKNNKNGFIKKRSELKIGALSIGEPSTIRADSPPVDDKKPPPGFTMKPPPGFNNYNVQTFPTLSNNNDLTFTNSTGQSYSILPSNQYKHPLNFQSRNETLCSKCLSVLNSEEAVKDFKNNSALFRSGNMSADKYYSYCKSVLGSNFNNIFVELLLLLPDIEKQNELYKAVNDTIKNKLVVCENCKQVLLKTELNEHHHEYHVLANHFPKLSNSLPSNNVWKK